MHAFRYNMYVQYNVCMYILVFYKVDGVIFFRKLRVRSVSWRIGSSRRDRKGRPARRTKQTSSDHTRQRLNRSWRKWTSKKWLSKTGFLWHVPSFLTLIDAYIKIELIKNVVVAL